jgi:glutaminase
MQVILNKHTNISVRVPFSGIIFFLLLLFLSACTTTQDMQTSTPEPSASLTQETVIVAVNSQLSDEQIKAALSNAYNKYKNNQDGKNADYIKALADVDSKLFGITVVTADGRVFDMGDTGSKFSIQSISKVFTYAKVMQENGPEVVKEKIGVNSTGLPFNSIQAIELIPTRTVNPFVNAGAISSTSLVKAKDSAQRWDIIKTNMDNFAGHKLEFNEVVYDSEVNDNLRNQAISKILQADGRMYSDPLEATTVYTKQCSVNVTSHDLAVMGSVLANQGVNPITHKKLIDASNTPHILAVMATAGLYDNAGAWLYETGTPAKSGVGGGILAVVPGKLAIGVFSPPLDSYGNSVRGQLAAASIINELGLNPYAPE